MSENPPEELSRPEPTDAEKAEHEEITGLPWPLYSLEVVMLRLDSLLVTASIQKGLRTARLCWAECAKQQSPEGIKAAIQKVILSDFKDHGLDWHGQYNARQGFGNLAKAWAITQIDDIQTLRDISRAEAIGRTRG